MFRLVALFCVCAASMPYLVDAITDEQRAKIREHLEIVGVKCVKEHTITEDDIANLRDKKVPTGPNAPCFLACMMKDIGVMDDQGMLQHDAALELAAKIFDEEELKVLSDFLHSCAPVNSEAVGDGEQGCERALQAYKCMIKNAADFGLSLA